MMKRLLVLLSFFIFFGSGCGTNDPNSASIDDQITILTGYLIEVNETILFNETISKEEFEAKTQQDIYDEYYFSSIRLNTKAVDPALVERLAFGQKVKVHITGGIAESAPAQATATKIEIVEE
ncbi:DUF3221 domain-containing protein [Fredinandcohnia humi]